MGRINMRADASQESGGYPLAEPGEYFLRVKRVKDGTTRTNRQKVDLLISILDEEGVEVGSAFHTVTFIPEGQPGHGIWLHVNHALGLPYDGEVDFDTDDYLGKECRGRVIQDTYEGKTRNKIEEFYVEDDGNQEAPAPAAAPAPAKAAAPAATPAPLEEVPF